MYYYYMISDNVFSNWLTSLVTFFDKTIFISSGVTHGEYNILRFCIKKTIENVSIKAYFKGESNILKCVIQKNR